MVFQIATQKCRTQTGNRKTKGKRNVKNRPRAGSRAEQNDRWHISLLTTFCIACLSFLITTALYFFEKKTGVKGQITLITQSPAILFVIVTALLTMIYGISSIRLTIILMLILLCAVPTSFMSASLSLNRPVAEIFMVLVGIEESGKYKPSEIPGESVPKPEKDVNPSVSEPGEDADRGPSVPDAEPGETGSGETSGMQDVSKPSLKPETVRKEPEAETEIRDAGNSSFPDFVTLRSEPMTLSDDDVREMVTKYNFFCKRNFWTEKQKWHNESGNFNNDFEDNGDGTITDYATELMWQQSGSDKWMSFSKVQSYVNSLNNERFAGYDDWRLPTLEELASLLEPEKVNGRHINPIFDRNQWWCWSAHKRGSGGSWVVYFGDGYIYWDDYRNYVRVVRSRQYG